MAYFKIGQNDYSSIVSGLKVSSTNKYNSQTNAAGNTVVDLINNKRSFEVSIIALDDTKMAQLQSDLASFNISISFRNPQTNVLEENVNCIIPTHDIEYYTIQANKVMYKAMTLKITEL